MYQLAIDTEELEWTPLDFPGVSMRTLHSDINTGEMTVLTRMEPGSVIPRHRHTHADETVFVVSGDFIEDGSVHMANAFFFGRRGTFHGPHATKTGCVLLTRFSAELDFITEA